MRRFEYSAGGSDKFWEIELDDNSFIVTYGRIGTKGQTQTKSFDSPQAARTERDKLIQEKLKKGYVEVSVGTTAAASTKRSKENLIEQLDGAGIDVTSFQRVSLEGGVDEDEERTRPDPVNSFYMIDVRADKILQAWKTARALVEKTGYYPVITEDYDRLFEYMELEDEYDSAATIKAALSVNIEEFFEEQAQGLSDDDDNDDDDEDLQGDWDSSLIPTESENFQVITSSGSGDTLLQLVFCPTKISWQVCAVLCWGNSNDGIDPSCHAAAHKYWGTKYDAELVCITSDTMEFTVRKPPTTQKQAMELAHEQFVYCPDIVHQGVETISNLGMTLINSGKWFFWWD